MLERRHAPLLSRADWLTRVVRYSFVAGFLVAATLALGAAGYHIVGQLPWADAWLEASLVLRSMGGTARMDTDIMKLFVGVYALMSGLVALIAAVIFFTPFLHRLMHRFHAEATNGEMDEARPVKSGPRI